MSLVSVYQKDDPTHNRRSMYQTGRAYEADNKFDEALSSYRDPPGAAAPPPCWRWSDVRSRPGVLRNAAEARQWFEKAAAGHPLAKARLAQGKLSRKPAQSRRRLPVLAPIAEPGHLALAARDIVLVGLTFPEYVSGFRRTSIADFEYKQPGMGYGLHYETGDAKATVFVYDGRASLLPEDSRTPRTPAQQHFSNVRRDILVAKSYTRAVRAKV